MITTVFLNNTVECLGGIIIVALLAFILRGIKKHNQDRLWNEYNNELDKYANNPKERDVFIDRTTRTTSKQRDVLWKLEENKNDVIYKALKRK